MQFDTLCNWGALLDKALMFALASNLGKIFTYIPSLSPGHVPIEDPHDGHLLGDHATQGAESASVDVPRHSLHRHQRRPVTTPRQQGIVKDRHGTEPPRRIGRGRRIMRHVRIRRGLFREDPERDDAEFVAAELSTWIDRNRVWASHGRRERRRETARERVLFRLRLGRVARHMHAVVRRAPRRRRRQIRRQHS